MNKIYVALVLLSFARSGFLLAAGAPSGWVIGWGSNIAGESTGVLTPGCSTGTVTSVNQPLDDIVAIAAGASHGVALSARGVVLGWGYNYYGQATGSKPQSPHVASGSVTVDGQVVEDAVAIAAAGNRSVAIRHGTVTTWGEGQTVLPSGLSNIVAVSCGRAYILVLQRDGTVVSLGGKTAVPPALSSVIAISAGPGQHYERNLALKRDGTVVTWGQETANHNLRPPSGLSNVVAVSAGWNHSLTLRRDGTVIGWGANGGGEATGDPTTNAPYISSGLVVLTGGVLTNVQAIAAGNGYSLALRMDGTVVAWGHPPRSLLKVWPVPAGLSNVIAVAAGDGFSLAITTNAAVAARFRR